MRRRLYKLSDAVKKSLGISWTTPWHSIVARFIWEGLSQIPLGFGLAVGALLAIKLFGGV